MPSNIHVDCDVIVPFVEPKTYAGTFHICPGLSSLTGVLGLGAKAGTKPVVKPIRLLTVRRQSANHPEAVSEAVK